MDMKSALDHADDRMAWLDRFAQQDGATLISENRPYQHEETAYDDQYRNDQHDQSGSGVINLLRRFDANFEGPILELGCGTGKASVGLCKAAPNPWLLITDASTTFIDIARRKMEENAVDMDRVRFAVLADSDLRRLPAQSVSAIILRSVLHHFLDVESWMRDAARLLLPGGVILVAEPCSSGYLMMGMISQAVALFDDNGLTPRQRKRAQLMADTMKAYHRRDLDKSEWEDKHVFRPDELMGWAQGLGLRFEFLPNATFENFAANSQNSSPNVDFAVFYETYLNFCMGFGDADSRAIAQAADPLCAYVTEASAGAREPYLMCIFAFQKPHAA